MTIRESTALIQNVDPADLDAVREALAERGRVLCEFASTADPRDLVDAQHAGDALLERIRSTRRSAIAELQNTLTLRKALHDQRQIQDLAFGIQG